jgi:Glycosyl hydrolases family 18
MANVANTGAGIVGEWWWCYGGPSVGDVAAQAPGVNYLSLVGSFVGGGGGGAVHTDFSYETQMIADIQAFEAAGKAVVGMAGGGGDSTVIANQGDANAFVQSAIPIIDKFHLQGVDLDFENTPNAGAVASVITQLKDHYGSDFIISMSPRPFELRDGGVYREVIHDAGINNIDLVHPQDYALNGDSLGGQRSYMDGDLNDWVHSGLVPASKLVIGSFDPGEGESVSTALDTYNYYKGVFPDLKGSMFWASHADPSFSWANGMPHGDVVAAAAAPVAVEAAHVDPTPTVPPVPAVAATPVDMSYAWTGLDPITAGAGGA